ncbi:MAG TPA: hypothetical protein DDY49_11430 [Paenibacillaceae bacterium]|nr:hypothetical protein [Paenibacillaceae bacterium]
MREGICPLCNGLESCAKECPNCHKEMEDTGKLENYYGPYSPYEEIDQLRLINGFPDLEQAQCLHVISCPHCGKQEMVAINEQHFL